MNWFEWQEPERSSGSNLAAMGREHLLLDQLAQIPILEHFQG